MRNFALIGHPLGHTMSPPIHQRLFELSGDTYSNYHVLDIPPEKFSAEAPNLMQLNGFNVTIPHKLNIIRYLDKLDLSAKRYGAVNVVKCGEKNVGYNTDVDGFLRSIQALGADLSQKVLLLGCGGAGRMMAIETALAGGDLTIAVRPSSWEKAENTANNIRILDSSARVTLTPMDSLKGGYDLILNATPCGMYPHTDELPIKADVLNGVKFVFDAIYNPSKTRLMIEAEQREAKVMGGMNMLVWQAVVAHEIWDQVSYEPAVIQALVSEMEARVGQDFA